MFSGTQWVTRCSFPPSVPSKIGSQHPQIFDPNCVQYDPQRNYTPDGKSLTMGQRICTFLIRDVYQKLMRKEENHEVKSRFQLLSKICLYKNVGKLSCSEYTLVMIHRFGVLKGIRLGIGRILRCNPFNTKLEDVPIPVSS